MRVYLIGAPEDHAEGEKLADYLKRFGVFIRSEFGQTAYPPARTGEFTLALWSRNAMRSSRQMMLTNRAIDAWADDNLVMARLEHGSDPRGLSDLEMIDMTMPSMRERRYHDVLNAIRRLDDARRQPRSAEDFEADASVPPSTENAAMMARPKPALAPQPAPPSATIDPRIMSQQRTSKSVAGRFFVILAAVGLALVAIIFLLFPKLNAFRTDSAVESPEMPSTDLPGVDPANFLSPLVLGIAAAALVLVLLGLFVFGRSSRKARKSENAAASEPVRDTAETLAEVVPSTSLSEASHVFVSYSHANADTVLPIVETVEQHGVSIWIDREEMRAGQTWAGQIVRAIKASDRFCLMCSEQSFASDHVRREVYLADKYGKEMVPVRLDGAEMPEDIEYFLIGRQWIDLAVLSAEERTLALQAALSAEDD